MTVSVTPLHPHPALSKPAVDSQAQGCTKTSLPGSNRPGKDTPKPLAREQPPQANTCLTLGTQQMTAGRWSVSFQKARAGQPGGGTCSREPGTPHRVPEKGCAGCQKPLEGGEKQEEPPPNIEQRFCAVRAQKRGVKYLDRDSLCSSTCLEWEDKARRPRLPLSFPSPGRPPSGGTYSLIRFQRNVTGCPWASAPQDSMSCPEPSSKEPRRSPHPWMKAERSPPHTTGWLTRSRCSPGAAGSCPALGSGLSGWPWQPGSRLSTSAPALPGCLVPASAATLALMQPVGPGLELWLASGFSGARPAVAAPGRAHSPCLASRSRSARRTAVGQDNPVAPGPQGELLSALRPASLCPLERGSLLAKPLGGSKNPEFGVPGPLKIEGVGDWLAGAGPSKGVLSSAPTPVGVNRTASASCRQQLAQTRA